MKLSIIIPYYKTYELTKRLLEVLKPQLNEETEVLIVNNSDGTNFNDNHIKTLYCESNGTASRPRNVGLDNAKGEYIVFIDSDDLVSKDYIEKILNKIDSSNFSYCFFSWQFLNCKHKIIIEDYPPQWNCSVWNCIYKRETIGDNRFNETMRIAEDYDFNVRVRKGKKANIEQVLYFYNDSRKGSIMNG
ncbi:MAG TPA: glycosyltransferase family 2 protein [Gallicola sp.]|nr:glycosyltransferase family 2 protein [Gallicola sp.]